VIQDNQNLNQDLPFWEKGTWDSDRRYNRLICPSCGIVLAVQFESWEGYTVITQVQHCSHWEWLFIGQPDLDFPDEEDKAIMQNAVMSVYDSGGGRYFLLPQGWWREHMTIFRS
jgi:hypothetical protein